MRTSLVGCVAILTLPPALLGQGPVPSADAERAPLTRYCACHNQNARKAGLDPAMRITLDDLDPAHVEKNSEAWERVVRKIRAGMIPPSVAWPVVLWGVAPSPIADAAVRTLVSQKADINAPQPDGAAALQWAVHNNDPALADLLIAAGANGMAANREDATPLFLACESGNAVMIEKLLKAGADANEIGPVGDTPLRMAARTVHLDAAKVLLDSHAGVNAKEKIRETTALMWTVEQQHPAVVKMLVEHGADLTATTMSAKATTACLAPRVPLRTTPAGAPSAGGEGRAGGQRPATPPAEPENVNLNEGVRNFFSGPPNECARILLDAGANINQTAKYGWTPLLTATRNKHYQLASMLLERGADPHVSNSGGRSPLATVNIARGANVNVRVCGTQSTPTQCHGDSTGTRNNFTMQWLHEEGAAQSGGVTLMKLPLEHGADPHIATEINVTAPAVAAGIGWVEGVAFEWSEAENVEAANMLLDMGLDPDAISLEGRSPLDGLAHRGRNAVAQLLVDHGAKLDQLDFGSRDTGNGDMLGHRWLPLKYAEGLVRKLMRERGIEVPAAHHFIHFHHQHLQRAAVEEACV